MVVDPSRRTQIDALLRQGYAVLPQFVPPQALVTLNEVARTQLARREGPLELEVDLHYPGAPSSAAAAGGTTVRRLLGAYERDPAFRTWATEPAVREWMSDYFGEGVLMSRAHHNCVMTKHPRYGSLTHWHRDSRYWSFAREDLVSVWIALGAEHTDNGALWFVPGSHRMSFGADRFDAAKFFRADHPDSTELLRTAECPRLVAGDAVFFHSNTLHSANRNVTDAVKFSLVYTYHGRSNLPQPGTRSAAWPEVDLEGSCPNTASHDTMGA